MINLVGVNGAEWLWVVSVSVSEFVGDTSDLQKPSVLFEKPCSISLVWLFDFLCSAVEEPERSISVFGNIDSGSA